MVVILQTIFLRFLIAFSISQNSLPPWSNASTSAIELVLNLPTSLPRYLYELYCSTSTKSQFSGLRRRGLGFSPFSHRDEKQTERIAPINQIDLPAFLAPQVEWRQRPLDLVKRPSASEARKKALVVIQEAPLPHEKLLYDSNWTILSQYPFESINERSVTTPRVLESSKSTRIWLSSMLTRHPLAPYTPVEFLELGPYTILLVPTESAYHPAMSDVLKIVYQALIVLLPPLLIFFLNPYQLSRLRISLTHTLFLGIKFLIAVLLYLQPSLIVILDVLAERLSLTMQLFLKAPELPEEYLMTSERWMERFKRSKDDLEFQRTRTDATQAEAYIIPQRRSVSDSGLNSTSMATFASNWVVLEAQSP